MDDSLPNVPYEVYVSSTLVDPLDDAWVWEPHLKCIAVTEGCSPTIEQARLVWSFGTERRAHREEADAGRNYVGPIDLEGKYVRIVAVAKGIEWYGYIRDDAASDWGQEEYFDHILGDDWFRTYGGDQFWTAYDLKYMLDRTIISGTSTRQADRSKRPYGYNAGAGDGRSIDVARRANRKAPDDAEEDPYEPLEFDFTKDAVKWDAAAIVKHLLAEQCPRDQDDAPAPLAFVLDDEAIPYLDWYYPTVNVEGRTLLEVLDEVIDRRRGLTWWITGVDEFGEELKAVIRVSSIAAAAVSLPAEKTLPAAAVIVTIPDPNELNLIQEPEYGRHGANRWHRIRVRGARRTTTFSAVAVDAISGPRGYAFPIDVNSRINGEWDAADAAAYLAGVSAQDGYGDLEEQEKKDKNDRYRQTQRFEQVFRYFSISTATGGGLELSPVIVQSTGSVVGDMPMEKLTQRLQTTTPLRIGVDYTSAVESEPYGTIRDGEEYVRPFVLVYLPRGMSFVPTTLGEVVPSEELQTSTDGGWRFTHRLNAVKETGFDDGETEVYTRNRIKPNFSLSILDGQPGFALTPIGEGGLPHSLATAVELEGLEPSNYGGGVAWSSTLITAAVEWDAYCESVWPEVAPIASPLEELLIDIGDRARFDYVAKGTVFDLDEHGHPKQVATGGAVRDDRELCETIARLAHQWYSQERRTATFEFNGIDRPWGLGDLITTVGSGDAAKTINAVVTQITHNLEDGNTTVQCNFPEVDFTTLT